MASKPRYTAAQVAAALRASRGLARPAAARLECDADTIHNYVRRYPSVRAAMQDARGALVDLAESQLEQALLRGEWQAIQFTLSRLGRDRGWGDATRHALASGDGQPITFTIALTRPHDGDDS